MKDNNLEKHFREELRNLEAAPPDGSKAAIEKHLLDAGLLKESAGTKSGLWMFVLLALLIATPVVYALRKTHRVQLAEATAQNNPIYLNEKNPIIFTSNKNEKVTLNGNKTTEVTISAPVRNDNVSIGMKRTKSLRHTNTKHITKEASLVQSSRVNSKKKKSASAEVKQTEQNNSSLNALADNSNNTVPVPISLTPGGNFADNETYTTKPDKLEEKKDTLTEKQQAALRDTTKHPKPTKEKIHKEIAFDFSGAPQFNAIIYGNGSQYYQQYVDESRRSEKETPSFCAAFGIVVSMNNFLAETGIKHSVLSSEFTYEQTIISLHQVRSYGTPPPWGHDSSQTTTHYIATNKIAFMEFPVLAGYRFHAGKFAFELKAGPMMSFITSANTTVISLNAGTVMQSNDLENSPYRKTCWSILSAGNILYSLGNRFSAFIEPSMKSSITSIFKESAPVTKKVQSFSAGIGLRVTL